MSILWDHFIIEIRTNGINSFLNYSLNFHNVNFSLISNLWIFYFSIFTFQFCELNRYFIQLQIHRGNTLYLNLNSIMIHVYCATIKVFVYILLKKYSLGYNNLSLKIKQKFFFIIINPFEMFIHFMLI